MTAAGIERGLLNFSVQGEVHGRQPTIPTTALITLDEFRAKCQEVADDLQGLPGPDLRILQRRPQPAHGRRRMVEIAVKEYDFRAVRMMGALTNCRPNDALCFPIYTKCIELGIPIVINIGFPGPLRYAKYQRPLDLDDVCVTFPELMVVATHNGHPWHLETVALLQKHANFRLMTSGLCPSSSPRRSSTPSTPEPSTR